MIIINLSKPSQVSTVRYLPITASKTIKVAYGHTRIVLYPHWGSESRVTATVPERVDDLGSAGGLPSGTQG
jgi:hypothetical protein